MPEPHPGMIPPPTYTGDPNAPLKAVKISPPSADHALSMSQPPDNYTVYVQLNRYVNEFEAPLVDDFFPRGRTYGNTLELSETNIEAVAAAAKEISGHLSDLENAAQGAKTAAAEKERAEKEAEDARLVEIERLKKVAESADFD